MKETAATATKNGPVQVAFYIRVSSDKQAKMEDGSLDTQLDRLESEVRRKRAAGHDWVVVERLIEGEKDGVRRGKSGKNANRPMYQKLLELAKAGLIDVVMISRLDRISRNLADFVRLAAMLAENKVSLVSLKEDLDLTTPAGRLFAHLLMSLAQYERETVASRVSDKAAWRAEKGLALGRAPTGYRSQDKRFVRFAPYDGHVQAADALYIARQSVDAVVKEFARLGYRTSTGAMYNKTMLLGVLRNPLYAGKIEHKGRLFDAQIEPLRSWEAHQKIQAILDRNERTHRSPARQPKDYTYLLQGLVRCGLCGHKMTPRPGTGRSGALYPYYHCSAANKSAGVACPQKQVAAAALDEAALEFLKTLNLKPERLTAFAERANGQASESMQRLIADRERVRAQISAVLPKIRNIVKAIENGTDMPSMHDALRGLESERADLDASDARIKSEIDAEQTQAIVVQDVIASLTSFHDLVEESAANPERIKLLLPRFVDYVVWHGGEKGEGRLEVALFQEPLAEPVPATADSEGPRFAGANRMVGPAGFEPATSTSQAWRASQAALRPVSSGSYHAGSEAPNRQVDLPSRTARIAKIQIRRKRQARMPKGETRERCGSGLGSARRATTDMIGGLFRNWRIPDS